MAEEHNGEKPIYCVHCGARNSGPGLMCVSCERPLVRHLVSHRPVEIKLSGLAFVSFALGLCSPLGGLTAIPAIVLGIIALVIIEKSGGRVTGKGFAIIGIAIPSFMLVLGLAFFLPALSKVKGTAFRMTCGSNLSGIGKAMLIYANDHDDVLPRAGGTHATWGTTVWNAPTRATAYMDNGTTSQASISSCFYLLIKYAEIPTKTFICTGDEGTREFELSKENCPPDFDLIDAWDFGSIPVKHCSYSYHMPFSEDALEISSEPGLAVASERNPWLDSPGASAKTPNEFASFIPDTPEYGGDIETAVMGNATTHKGKGQNVLYLDCHVEFTKRSFCSLEDDNIFTRSVYGDKGDPKGKMPVPSPQLGPANKKDNLLLHDVPMPQMTRR